MTSLFSNETSEFAPSMEPHTHNAELDEAERRDLQHRVDQLLSGRAAGSNSARDRRLFAAFVASDQQAASSLAAAWMNMADEKGGFEGLKTAVDHMYHSLDEDYPLGFVKYAVSIFLTHYAPARAYLHFRNLEELQPNAVRPSEDQGASERRRLIANL